MGLIQFLNARLDEDEHADWHVYDCASMFPGCCIVPERVRREVAAKRARLTLMIEATEEMDRLIADDDASTADQTLAIGRCRAATVAVKHDAAVYSDHPDYQQKWAP